MNHTRSHTRTASRLATLLLSVLLIGGAVPGATVAVAADGDRFTFTGQGWGHGRGMGQYGALGYAIDHGWGYGPILDHFYGGTRRGSVGDRQISVELTALTGNELRAVGRGLTVNGVARTDANAAGSAVRVTRQPDGRFRAEVGAGCSGPSWTSSACSTRSASGRRRRHPSTDSCACARARGSGRTAGR